jgi:methionyl-tRNA synthetase
LLPRYAQHVGDGRNTAKCLDQAIDLHGCHAFADCFALNLIARGVCGDLPLDGCRYARDLDWGIDVPVEGAEGKKLYVWFDAPIGYISSTKEWAAREGKDWEPYWKDKDTKLVHFIGKDNIVFHCVIFPAMLKAEGSYILPDNVPANEFLNLEGNKLSTSKNI